MIQKKKTKKKHCNAKLPPICSVLGLIGFFQRTFSVPSVSDPKMKTTHKGSQAFMTVVLIGCINIYSNQVRLFFIRHYPLSVILLICLHFFNFLSLMNLALYGIRYDWNTFEFLELWMLVRWFIMEHQCTFYSTTSTFSVWVFWA
jgi:hypothetical protein